MGVKRLDATHVWSRSNAAVNCGVDIQGHAARVDGRSRRNSLLYMSNSRKCRAYVGHFWPLRPWLSRCGVLFDVRNTNHMDAYRCLVLACRMHTCILRVGPCVVLQLDILVSKINY